MYHDLDETQPVDLPPYHGRRYNPPELIDDDDVAHEEGDHWTIVDTCGTIMVFLAVAVLIGGIVLMLITPS